MSCLGVPPTRDQQNSPPPFQRLQSVKKMSCFIFVCLRSVHSLLSFRFGGRSSYLTHVHPSLHCVQFISPTSAPHSKSNSFSAFRKAITQAFRVMAFAYPSLQWLLFFDKLQKPPTLLSKLLMPLQATNPVCSITFSHCICSWPTARLKAVCFIFSCEVFTPADPRKTFRFQLKFNSDW